MKLSDGMGKHARDIYAASLLVILPFLMKIHLLVGIFNADAATTLSGLGTDVGSSLLNMGAPTIDPNVGYTSQALGHLAASFISNGVMPYWNPYEGIGTPLLGEMQSAALFPLTPLLLLHNGQLYFHISLQIICGVSTYLFLRKIGVLTLGALVAACLFEFNGTYAWLANAVINPIAFLPMTLYGVEVSRSRSIAGYYGGWFWISSGIALSLLSGFPEVAYLNGLLISVWSLVRVVGLDRKCWKPYFISLFGGVACGVAMSAPALIAFVSYLTQANTGGHATGAFVYSKIGVDYLFSLFAPYAYGVIFQSAVPDNVGFWGSVGGYAGIALIGLAIAGSLGARLRSGRVAFAGWAFTAIAATFGLPVFIDAVNALPAMKLIAYHRYLAPSWEFSLTCLAGFAIDDLMRREPFVLGRIKWAIIVVSLMAAGAALLAWRHFLPNSHDFLREHLIIQPIGWLLAVITITNFVMAYQTGRNDPRRMGIWLSGVALLEAFVYFIIPTFSYPRSGSLELSGVKFLQQNLGFQRFYTLAPISPNYGSYFEIASINHNDLPLPASWVDFVKDKLDNNTVDILFTGFTRLDPNGPSALQNLRQNISEYENLGVRYVVTTANDDLLGWVPDGGGQELRENTPLALSPGSNLAVSFNLPDSLERLSRVGVMLGTYSGKSDGNLKVTVCSGVKCATGFRDLKTFKDNGVTYITLENNLIVTDRQVTITFSHIGGSEPACIWVWKSPQNSDRSMIIDGKAVTGREPWFSIDVEDNDKIKLVHEDSVSRIYELSDPKPYFDAPGCRIIDSNSRQEVRLRCETASPLTRRELYFPGWTATVNGHTQSIFPVDKILQGVNLPEGASVVKFEFAPSFIGAGWLLVIVGGLGSIYGIPRRGADLRVF